MAPLFLAMVGLVLWQRRREQRTVAAQLPGFAMAGWISPSEVALLSTLGGTQPAGSARCGSARARRPRRPVTEYQTAVTELAFLRARMSRGAVGPHAWDLHNERLHMLTVARARAMGQPAALHRGLAAPSGPRAGPRRPRTRPGWRPDPSPAARAGAPPPR